MQSLQNSNKLNSFFCLTFLMLPSLDIHELKNKSLLFIIAY